MFQAIARVKTLSHVLKILAPVSCNDNKGSQLHTHTQYNRNNHKFALAWLERETVQLKHDCVDVWRLLIYATEAMYDDSASKRRCPKFYFGERGGRSQRMFTVSQTGGA
jgi:hypothetical protein